MADIINSISQDIISRDAPEFLKLLKEFNSKIVDVRKSLELLVSKVNDNLLETSNGVSFLEVKIHTLLSYLTNLAFYLLLKSSGKQVENHPVINQLVELRAILEKSKPLEAKLKYQIDKLIKAASGANPKSTEIGDINADPLQFKPNPKNMMFGDETSSDHQDKSTPSDGIYRPPKLVPVPYSDSSTKTGSYLTSSLKERAGKSRLVHDLRSQYDDRPDELDVGGTGYTPQEVGSMIDQKIEERENYEEENFMRFTLSKKDKKLREKISKGGVSLRVQDEFDNLQNDFSSLASLQRVIDTDDRDKTFSPKRSKSFQHTDVSQLIESHSKIRKRENSHGSKRDGKRKRPRK